MYLPGLLSEKDLECCCSGKMLAFNELGPWFNSQSHKDELQEQV